MVRTSFDMISGFVSDLIGARSQVELLMLEGHNF
jgi:hypothetical protein